MSSEIPPDLSTRSAAAARLLAAVGVLAGSLALGAEPAAAHGASDRFTLASNYIVDIRSTPDLPGLRVDVSDLDGTIELRWSRSEALVVLGYENEPYLRIDEAGTSTNTSSPAAYLNLDRYAQVEPPPGVDAAAAPTWTTPTGETTVRWHDHRTHWMSPSLPPVVAAAPDRSHTVIENWQIPLVVLGKTEAITGSLRWAPPPPVAGWSGMIALVGLAAWTLLRTGWRYRHTLIAGLAACAVIADGAAYWAASGSGMPVVFVAVALLATWRVARSDARYGRAPLALAVVGFDALFIVGLDRLGALQQRFVASAFPANVSRAVVVAGVGLGAAAVLRTVLSLTLGEEEAVPHRAHPRPADDGATGVR